MAPLCWEVVTFVIAVQKTACRGDSELMGPELKLKLSLNCGLEYSKRSPVWVVGGGEGAGGTRDRRERLLVPLERSEKLYKTFLV